MNILIATPYRPPHLGGPAKYAGELVRVFSAQGHRARIVSYGWLEQHLPVGVRHTVYLFRLIPHLVRTDVVLALDTWSVGLPALCGALLLRKKFVVRIGGDIVWEQYVERTGNLVMLSEFYTQPRQLSFKERLIKKGTGFLVRHAHALVFTTEWQRALWCTPYSLVLERTHIIENHYPAPHALLARAKVFVAAGRPIKLKNMARLREAFALAAATHPDITLDERTLPPNEHAERLHNCYAVLVPSVSEVNPNALIEAVALGKPFVGPKDCGGVVRLQGAGLFVDTTDVHVLAQAIESLLDSATYTRCVAATQKVQPYSWEDMAGAYITLFHTL